MIKVKIRSKGEHNPNNPIYQIIDLDGNILEDDLCTLKHEKIQGLKQTETTGIYVINH